RGFRYTIASSKRQLSYRSATRQAQPSAGTPTVSRALRVQISNGNHRTARRWALRTRTVEVRKRILNHRDREGRTARIRRICHEPNQSLRRRHPRVPHPVQTKDRRKRIGGACRVQSPRENLGGVFGDSAAPCIDERARAPSALL